MLWQRSQLSPLIVVHELGHFIAARSQGIHVNRFSGFGPVLFKYQGQKPSMLCGHFGWLCWLSDDDPDSKIPPNDPNPAQPPLTGQL